MSENLTISQLAKELNVSRQKIYRFIDKQENNYIHQCIYTNSKKIKMINAEGVRYIKENIYRTTDGQDPDSGRTKAEIPKDKLNDDIKLKIEKEYRTADGQNPDNERTVFFIKQIEQKDIQIQTLQKIIEQNQNLLDQQQRLALQDKKLLEEYKEEINELRALKMPFEDVKQDKVQEEVERLKEQVNILEEKRAEILEKETLKPQSKKWWHFGRV